jgi:hypothetical protein
LGLLVILAICGLLAAVGHVAFISAVQSAATATAAVAVEVAFPAASVVNAVGDTDTQLLSLDRVMATPFAGPTSTEVPSLMSLYVFTVAVRALLAGVGDPFEGANVTVIPAELKVSV